MLHRCGTTREYGLTLVEILVTIVIISFGLLGVASLQVKGLQNNHSAFNRSTANILAYDMLDRMRANKSDLIAGKYDSGGKFLAYATDAPSTTTTMKDTDLKAWLLAISKRLPSGKGKIEASAAATTIRVTIQWDDTRGTNATGSEVKSLSIEAQGCGSDAASACYF